jgi:formate dehydrogenase major subunit
LGLWGSEQTSRWPVLRQLKQHDLEGLGRTALSPRIHALKPRTKDADEVVRSVCPYCAVGCGQLVYKKGERITCIEGDPDSPISEGCLCPKGAATFQLVTGAHRVHKVLYPQSQLGRDPTRSSHGHGGTTSQEGAR